MRKLDYTEPDKQARLAGIRGEAESVRPAGAGADSSETELSTAPNARDQRRAGIEARNSLSPEEREARSRAIAERILESREFEIAETVMSYRAVKGEVSLERFNAEAVRRGKRVVYPLCVSGTEMTARLPHSEATWASGRLGIMEPLRDRSDGVAPEDIDLVLCPCTAFDEARNRLGMGGGFYDRYLPGCVNARIAAVAFEAQKLARVLTEVWDVRMDKVYTEKTCY